MYKINEMLLKLETSRYATTIDFNMVYDHIRLIDSASSLCEIILHWGKYSYKHLPMGIDNYPKHFQQKMNDLFHGF